MAGRQRRLGDQVLGSPEDDIAVPDRESVNDLIGDGVAAVDSGTDVAGNGVELLGGCEICCHHCGCQGKNRTKLSHGRTCVHAPEV